jgi:hypothetical protein
MIKYEDNRILVAFLSESFFEENIGVIFVIDKIHEYPSLLYFSPIRRC